MPESFSTADFELAQ